MNAKFTIVRTTQTKVVWDSPFKTIEGSEAEITVFAENQSSAIQKANGLSGNPAQLRNETRYVYRVIGIAEVAE